MTVHSLSTALLLALAAALLLAARVSGVEFYSYQCNSGDLWTVRCELRQCRILK